MEARQKRGQIIGSPAILNGMRAVKTLLKDTKLEGSSKRGRVYKKIGGLSAAIKDFESVSEFRNLEHHKYWIGLRAQLGDREITIQKEGWLEYPTIFITKKGKDMDLKDTIETIDTIYYKDSFKLR